MGPGFDSIPPIINRMSIKADESMVIANIDTTNILAVVLFFVSVEEQLKCGLLNEPILALQASTVIMIPKENATNLDTSKLLKT